MPPSTSMLPKPLPVTVLSGFLGAGKTTLLRTLLAELKQLGRTADVFLNDFENAEIDASTLPEYTASISPMQPVAPTAEASMTW